MILSTKGKLAANAVEDVYGKGFPADLVKRTRAMLSALDAATVLEDLRFRQATALRPCREIGSVSIRCASTSNGAFALSGQIKARQTLRLWIITEVRP